MATIHPLYEVDPALVVDLLDLAFEPERKRRTAYKVREGTECLAALSFAALDEGGHLCGTIQCWPVALTDRVRPSGEKTMFLEVGRTSTLSREVQKP